MQGQHLIPTRRSLVSRLRDSDDQESWRQFFETYWKLIYSFAIKCGCTDSEAEEVVQETIISVSKKMPEFRYEPSVCSFKGWLLHVTNCRVIDNLCKRNHLIRQKRGSTGGKGSSALAEVPDPLAPELERIWKEEWEKNIIDAALERVKRKANPQQYQVFYLLMIKKRTVPEVAELLGINRGQIVR